jgi:hypothetical protein
VKKNIILTGYSRQQIQDKIDTFLKDIEGYQSIHLIQTVNGSSGYTYRGVPVREWWLDDNVRYDCGFELKEDNNEI